MRRPGNLLGIGIDLLSWKRARRFLAAHSFEFLKRLLTPSEQKAFRKSGSPLDFFVRAFTAKEAYFKACGGNGLAEAGLEGIETRMKEGNGFEVLSSPFDPSGALWTEGRFFETSEGLGAEAVLWGRKEKAGP